MQSTNTSTPDERTDPTLRLLRDRAERLPPQWMALGQAEAIYRLFLRYERPPTRVLEIGTYLGRGAILLATMVQPWGGRVVSVDLPWTGQPNKHFDKIGEQWVSEFKLDNVQFVRRPDGAEGFLHDHFLAGAEPWDFIYIDGGHNWLNVAAQFAMAMAAVRPGAWIGFDDIRNPAWPEPGEVWDHVVCDLVPPENRYTVGMLGFARRA